MARRAAAPKPVKNAGVEFESVRGKAKGDCRIEVPRAAPQNDAHGEDQPGPEDVRNCADGFDVAIEQKRGGHANAHGHQRLARVGVSDGIR